MNGAHPHKGRVRFDSSCQGWSWWTDEITLRVLSVLGHRCFATVPPSHFAPKNNPPDCFFTVLTLTGFESDHSLHQGWSWWTDSNPRPADYKSAALPTELHQHFQRSNIIAYKTDFVKQKFCFFHTFSKVFCEYLRLWAAQRYDRSLRIKYNLGVGACIARPPVKFDVISRNNTAVVFYDS